MGARRNATNVASNNNNSTTNNVVAVKDVKVIDIYRTKFDNNIVVQVDKTFAGFD